MNLLAASLRDGRLLAGPFTLEPPAGVGDLRGRRLEVGIRPEHVVLEPTVDDAHGQVEVVETAGSETIVYVTAGEATVVARISPELVVDVGTPVRLAASPRNAYVFDADTGLTVAGIGR